MFGLVGPLWSVRPRPGAATTVMPSSFAALRSNISNCVPVASNNLRLGSWHRSETGKAVRSLMVEMTSKGRRRSTRRAVSASLVGTIVFLKVVICSCEEEIWVKCGVEVSR